VVDTFCHRTHPKACGVDVNRASAHAPWENPGNGRRLVGGRCRPEVGV
jgi:hypothetical protein